MGSNWTSNEGSYNWDAGLLCSWNTGLSPAISHRNDARRRPRALRLGVVVVLKREPPTLYPLIDVMLDAGFKLCVWDAGFKLCVLALKWSWDASFESYILALQWCWGAGFKPCILALNEWLWLASRLKYRLCYLMTYPKWFLDSLQPPFYTLISQL